MITNPKNFHDPYSALRVPDFRRYVISNFLLIFANQMVSTTIGWELYEKTGRALDLGLTGLSTVLPFFLFALLGGNVADRFNRRIVIVLATAAYSLALVGLALTSAYQNHIPLFRIQVFLCLFLGGACNAFYIPAKQALLRQLVPRRDLLNAVTWGSTSFQLAAVTGPAVCGLLIGRFPYFWIYGNAVIFEAIFIAVLLSLNLNETNDKKAPISLESLVEGGKFVWNTKPILATITLDLFAVLLGGCTALLPIFVKDILHSGPETLGWLRAAPSFGAFLMALLMAGTPMKKPGLTLLWAVSGFGAATIVFGLSTNLWLSLVMMFVIGGLDEISVILRGTLVQVMTPDRLLGRVQSVNFLFIYSSNELGAFESGVTAHLLGILMGPVAGTVTAVVLGGMGSIGIVWLVSRLWPQVANLKSLQTKS